MTELEKIAADLDRQADALQAFLDKQSSFYVQYEDQGMTAVRIRELRDQAKRIRCETKAVSPSERPHVESPNCWCHPTADYVDPTTGVTLYVHHKPT
jgi:hypothetical protein